MQFDSSQCRLKTALEESTSTSFVVGYLVILSAVLRFAMAFELVHEETMGANEILRKRKSEREVYLKGQEVDRMVREWWEEGRSRL